MSKTQKTNKKEIVSMHLPTSEIKGISAVPNNFKDEKNGYFIFNKYKGKTVKQKDLIVLSNKNRVNGIVLYPDFLKKGPKVEITITLSDLKKALNKVENQLSARKTLNHGQYIHISPDVSIWVENDYKKKKVKQNV